MPLNAAYSGLPVSGNKPLTVVYTDSSDDGGNVIIKWYWDFGDGFYGNSQNPTHVYKRAGVYTVALTVWDDIGNTDTETKVAYITVTETNYTETKGCLRFATEVSEGQGWNECSGDSWVEPEINWGALPIVDDYKVPRALIIDRDGGIFELDTFDRIASLEPPWLDKEDVDDTEIVWEKHCPEEVISSDQQNVTLKDNVSFTYIRPQSPSKRGEAGYTATGLRDAQELILDAYVDGEKITPAATADDFPENGSVVFSGSRVEGNRIQYVIKGTASELQITGRRHELLSEPNEGSVSNRTMTEHTAELALATPAYWLSRGGGRALLYERVGKNTLDGDITAVTGPDARAESGMQLNAALALGNDAIAGAYTVIFWRTAGITVPALPALTDYGTSGTWTLSYVTNLVMAADLIVNGIGSDIFDFRIYSGDVTAYAVNLFNDVVRNAGFSFLRPF